MEILKRLYYFFVNSNFLIAMAAVAQCALTYIILDLPVNPYILVIEGATTLLLYNLSLYLSLPKDPQSSPYQRTRWIGKNLRFLWAFSILAVLLTAWALLHLHILTLFFLGFVGLVSLAYAVPIVQIAGKKIGLRQVPGLKVFYIALVWSLSSVGLPVVELYANHAVIDWYMANYLGLVKILFLLLCTLPFDIRDYEQDSYYKLKTIPIILGKEKAILLSYGMGLFHILLMLVSPYSPAVKWGMVLTSVFVLLLFKFVIFTDKKHYHHVYLLDMALIVQWFAVWVWQG
ncbi:hypothetical protein [Sphingobacterium kyonggiense]